MLCVYIVMYTVYSFVSLNYHRLSRPVTMDIMLGHCQAVARGANRAFLVGDMPFGSYETDSQRAYDNAIRFLKEGGMDCVKLEGGRRRKDIVRYAVDV